MGGIKTFSIAFVVIGVLSSAFADEFSFSVQGEAEMYHIQVLNEYRASAIVNLCLPEGKGAHHAGISYRIDKGPWDQISYPITADTDPVISLVVRVARSDRPWTNSTIDYIPWVQFVSGRNEANHIHSASWNSEPAFVVTEHAASLLGDPWFHEVSYNETSEQTFVSGTINIRVEPGANPGNSVAVKIKFNGQSDDAWHVIPAQWNGDAERNSLVLYSIYSAQYGIYVNGRPEKVDIQLVAHRREHWPMRARLGRVAPKRFDRMEISTWPVQKTLSDPGKK